MPWTPNLPTKARREPLSYTLLNKLYANQRWLINKFQKKHTAAGDHNDLHVPRAVALAVWDGVSAYTLTGNSGPITSLTRNGVGDVTVNLNSSYFSTPIIVKTQAMDNDGDLKPTVVVVDSATTSAVQVKIAKLSSALLTFPTGGNNWAAADGTFAIAIHASPFAFGTGKNPPPNAVRGGHMAPGSSILGWNQFVTTMTDLYTAFTAGHTTAGVHNTRVVARNWGRAEWNETDFDVYGDSSVSSMTYTTQGSVTINFAASTVTTPAQVFAAVDWQRSIAAPTTADLGSIYNIVVPYDEMTSSSMKVYMYRHFSSAVGWARFNTDFAWTIHQAAV